MHDVILYLMGVATGLLIMAPPLLGSMLTIKRLVPAD